MKGLRATARLLKATGHALGGLRTIWFVFPRLSQPERNATVQAWARRMLEVLGITLQLHGEPPDHGPVLLVANHISWLDILVMHAARHCRFVSKSEVRHWPLVGALATGGGTLYVERASRRDAMRVVHQMAAALQAGDILAVFPEGTTTDGRGLLPFHGNLLQAAIATGSPVQPVALRFVDTGSAQPSQAVRYIDDDSLLGSIWRLVSGAPATAIVTYGVPQRSEGRDRRAWAADLRGAVQQLRGPG